MSVGDWPAGAPFGCLSTKPTAQACVFLLPIVPLLEFLDRWFLNEQQLLHLVPHRSRELGIDQQNFRSSLRKHQKKTFPMRFEAVGSLQRSNEKTFPFFLRTSCTSFQNYNNIYTCLILADSPKIINRFRLE